MKKKNKCGRLTVHDFKTYYTDWPKGKYTDQWHRIDSPAADPQMYGQLIFCSECQDNSMRRG